MEIKSLRKEDAQIIFDWERSRLASQGLEEIEIQMESWKSRWRMEELEHYLEQGWCFGMFSGEKLQAYVLAKVIPFFRAHTQVLWVENFAFENTQGMETLTKVVYSYAREKHLQSIFCEDENFVMLSDNKDSWESVDKGFYRVKTSKNED
jgi:hypothetical protein